MQYQRYQGTSTNPLDDMRLRQQPRQLRSYSLTNDKKEKKMSNFMTPVAKKVVKLLRSGTTKGKVDRLEDLSKSLTENTALVAQKYEELKTIETEVKEDLKKIKGEEFTKEIAEIKGMDLLPEEDRTSFQNALMVVKEKAIKDLEPIGETAQRVKAHMLVTMHKALQQKILLVAKSKLAGNATLQLETLRIIQKETKDINVDLHQLLKELDELNRDALNKHSAFEKDVKDRTEEGVSAVDGIVNRMETLGKREKITK